MRYIIFFGLLMLTVPSLKAQKISTLEIVEVLNKNQAEAEYYYRNNWKVLREQALKSNYIDSFEFMIAGPEDGKPGHIVLLTTYANREQYEKAEENFGKLIEALGGIKLLNDKKPADFRKFIYSQSELVSESKL
ncbi:hypothetical protein [Roseivirga thermotolerans]|uniref:hypothetical protein n=1 Tax=Roseivirga thermotolerans TaxID=1758176 RepID=UPI00273DFDF8|nr:hypothetical protein [Roseivirga thermotolerans]